METKSLWKPSTMETKLLWRILGSTKFLSWWIHQLRKYYESTHYYGVKYYGNQLLWKHTLLWSQVLWKPNIAIIVETKYGSLIHFTPDWLPTLVDQVTVVKRTLQTMIHKDCWEIVELNWFCTVSKRVQCFKSSCHSTHRITYSVLLKSQNLPKIVDAKRNITSSNFAIG